MFVIDRVKAKNAEIGARWQDDYDHLVRECFTDDEWDTYIKEVDLWMEIMDEAHGEGDIDGALKREIVARGIEKPSDD